MMDDSSMQVQLLFSGRNLKDLDFFSKSDPFVKIYMQRTFHGNLDYIGRTETIANNINPNWKNKIPVQYYFEMKQPLRIEVYDQDDSKNADFIGKGETSLGTIMGNSQQTLILDIVDNYGKNSGKIVIRGEKIEESSHSLIMKWKGGKIANLDSFFDFWNKSDPYLKFLKIRGDNTFVEAARTEILMDNQEPNWKPITVPANRLVAVNNPMASFKVECWDFGDKEQEHQFIGEIYIKMEDLQKPCPVEFNLVNPKIKKPGKLILEKFQIIQTPNFVDYLKSGLELNLVVAIDFTGSNGSPSSSNSLHYMGPNPTQYQQVLRGIWEIIENYDSDKSIPSFGFGAKPHYPTLNQQSVNHCFPLTGDYNAIQISGFQNLMGAYAFALKNIDFSGPTYFAPLLSKAFQVASTLKNLYSYQILLILTDGQIHDMDQTKNLIVQNCQLPISIIIVGIGNSDFANMVALDGDSGLFSSKGQKCPRDIVQFVPFNKFGGSASMLTQELLRQIPGQVVQYMVFFYLFQSMIGRAPELKPPVDIEQILPSSNQTNPIENVLNFNK